MLARDIIVIARRNAGLSQRELAQRLAVPQATVGRWEAGLAEPRFSSVQGACEACGFDLDLGLATRDRSYWPDVREQLALAPAERLAQLCGAGFADRALAVGAAGMSAARTVVIGDTAGALQGWPLLLPSSPVVLVAHADDIDVAEQTIAAVAKRPEAVEVTTQSAGGRGYRDLARSADWLDYSGGRLRVASVVDLLGMAMSDVGQAQFVPALEAVLDVRREQHSVVEAA